VVTEEIESCSSVHLPHDAFGSGIDAFGAPVVVGQREGGIDCRAVEFEAVGEGV
jgi:hypothetical protein